MGHQVRLLAMAGRMEQALEASEQARARAFVDLLAAREELAHGPVHLPVPAVPASGGRMLSDGTNVSAKPIDDLVANIRRRVPALALSKGLPTLDDVLAAPATARPDITRAAAMLRTHLLIYWVAERETLIWVVAPDGRITSAKSAIDEEKLAALVRSTWAANPSTVAAARGQSSPNAAAEASPDARDTTPVWAPALRGEGRLAFDVASQRAFTDLDRFLIAPVRAALPRNPDALVTIVPHGALFRLSFAPLMSPRGRYLIENARLSCTPSVATLLRASTSAKATGSGPSLVVADPELAIGLARSERLARLPGASAEGRAVSRALGAASTTFLSGPTASEARVRTALPSARVVHFATHGVIRDDEPLTSFLALGGSAKATADDGRLTTAEVYELSLDADLVVLSACRSALGPVTGDGLIGLTARSSSPDHDR